MTNHPNRSRKAHGSYAIRLNVGRLWKNHDAASAAIFTSIENAQATINGFSGRGALANPRIVEIVSGATEDARLCDGYYVREF